MKCPSSSYEGHFFRYMYFLYHHDKMTDKYHEIFFRGAFYVKYKFWSVRDIFTCSRLILSLIAPIRDILYLNFNFLSLKTPIRDILYIKYEFLSSRTPIRDISSFIYISFSFTLTKRPPHSERPFSLKFIYLLMVLLV